MTIIFEDMESSAAPSGPVAAEAAPAPFEGHLVTIELSGRQRVELSRRTGRRVRALRIVVGDLDALTGVIVHAGAPVTEEEPARQPLRVG